MRTFFTRLPLVAAAIVAAAISPTSASARDGLRQQAEWNRALQQALDEAGAELRSDKPNEVARGAFRAAEYRVFTRVPDLIAKLTAPPTGDDREVYAVRAALLDSAVRLDAAAPASVVRSYWNDFPVPSAIVDSGPIVRRRMGQQHRAQHLPVLRQSSLAALLIVHVACSPASDPARQQSVATASSPVAGPSPAGERKADDRSELPDSVKPTDVEIQWRSGGGDGCASPHCADYRITLRGDGVVTVEDLGWGGEPPRLPAQTRSIKEDEFIALLNQLLEARFVEIPTASATTRVARRIGDSVHFYYGGGGSGAWVDLTLSAGSYRKTLRVSYSDTTPTALRGVVDRIWRIGGINAKQ